MTTATAEACAHDMRDWPCDRDADPDRHCDRGEPDGTCCGCCTWTAED